MALSEVTISKCSEHLSACKSACEIHPDLKSFVSSLQQRTNKAIESLTAEAEKRTNIVIDTVTAKAEKRNNKEINSLTAEAETVWLSSQHAAHMEVTKPLQEVSQGVADFIVNSEEDVWENKYIRALVEEYFANTKKVTEILDRIIDCVDKAELGQLLIQQAVSEFHKELSQKDVGGKKNKYERTLKKLKEFKAKGDPFDGLDLTTQFELIKEEQESLLKKVSETKDKLKDEYAKLSKVSVISDAVLGVAVAGLAIVSIALMASGLGAVAVTVGIGLGISAMLAPIGWAVCQVSLKKLMDAKKRHMDALEALEKALKSEGKGIEINKNALESVSDEVHRLEKKISSMLEVVGNAIESAEEETGMIDALELIRKKVQKLTEGIQELVKAVSDCRKVIVEARYRVMEKIKDSV